MSETIRVSELTYEKINTENRSGESMDETLGRLLGLRTDTHDIRDDFAAYLDDPRLREQVETVADFIDTLGEVHREMADGEGFGGSDVLKFVADDSGLTIAEIECTEDRYTVKYRAQDRAMKAVDSDVKSVEDVDLEELKSQIERKVSGSIRKWGSR